MSPRRETSYTPVIKNDHGVQSMTLALALFQYFPYGGLQRNFFRIAEELRRRGHDTLIYTGQWDGPRPEGWQITELNPPGLANHSRNRAFHRQLTARLQQRPADLLIGFNKMPGLDLYYAADTCFAAKAREQKGPFYRLTPRCRWSLRFEEAVFAPSASTHILLLSEAEGRAYRKYYQTPEHRFHLVPPGISRDRVRNATSDDVAARKRVELGLSTETKILTFIGSDYRRKGLDRILTAMAALPEPVRASSTLLVVGRERRQPLFEATARRLGIDRQCRFLGQRDDIPDLLFASHLLLHPAYSENTGNVLLEAAVAGVPALCSGICGYSHYIREHQLGIVVDEPFDQERFNHALEHMLTENQPWRQRCLRFTQTADIFSRPQRAADVIETLGRSRPDHSHEAHRPA